MHKVDQERFLKEAVTLCNLGSKTWGGQTYTNVFTGESLVETLTDDPTKFPSRASAVKYSQQLLDNRVITCVTKRGAFDDSDRLYYITQDDTHKTTTSSSKTKDETGGTKINGFAHHDKVVIEKGRQQLHNHQAPGGKRLINDDYRRSAKNVDVILKNNHSKSVNDEKLTSAIKAVTTTTDKTKHGDSAHAKLNGVSEPKKSPVLTPVSKGRSPLLSALIAQDEKNNRLHVKEAHISQDVGLKSDMAVKSGTPATKTNEETHTLSNSWDKFELKLQNKVKNTSPRKIPEVDITGVDQTKKSGSGVDVKVKPSSHRIVSSNDGSLTGSMSKPENHSKHHHRLLDDDVMMSKNKTELNIPKQDGLLTTKSGDKSSRRNSFLNDGPKLDQPRSRGSSFLSNNDKHAPSGHATKEGIKLPSDHHGDSQVVIIEDGPPHHTSGTSGILDVTKNKRSSSFNVDLPENKSVDDVASSGNHHSTPEELVVIDGHSMPKALAALVAKDSSVRVGQHAMDNDHTTTIKYTLKEQKKSPPQTKTSSVPEHRTSPTAKVVTTTPVFGTTMVDGEVPQRTIKDVEGQTATFSKHVDTEDNATKSHLRLNLSPSQNTPDSPSSVPLVNTTRPTSLHISDVGSVSVLREELQRSRDEFEREKQRYENQITELQLQLDYVRRQNNGEINDNGLDSSASMSDLSSLYSNLLSPGDSISPSITPVGTPRSSIAAESPRSPPPPPPPAPPSAPPAPHPTMSPVKPNKPVVNPKINMKPLFWSRIISSGDKSPSSKSVWQKIKEPVIDTNEFERLFSKKSGDRTLKRTKSLRDDKHFARVNGKKVVKLLDSNRSRAIGIKMSSLNCQLVDIKNAVYNMDTSVVDMESLQFIYDIYPKENEIEIIQQHVTNVPNVPLDKPEEFMYQLMMMKHFKERLHCWLFQEKFNEVVTSIDRSLNCLAESCSSITSNNEITCIISFVLAYGNYMNGNTVRGQADGFHLDILLKLRDIKAKDSDLSLLHYIIKQYLKQCERGNEKSKNGEPRLPSSISLTNAAQVSFKVLDEELSDVSLLLKESEMQAKKIIDECPPDQRNPFEENMRKFQTTAKQRVFDVNHKMGKTKTTFRDALEYFQWDTDAAKKNPKEFFTLWANFMEDVKSCIKLEKHQQQLVKKNSKKVEHLNQIRETASQFRKRRQSVELIR